ncbi:cytochrome bd oxidase small subunit CydS [Neobacillus sp. K501]
MDEFFIFYAPLLFVFLSIVAAFWIAVKDDAIK